MELVTSRLRLRLPRHQDAAWLYTLNQDPLWLRFIGNRGVHSLLDAQRYVDHCCGHFDNWGYGLLSVELRMTGQPIGMCGLINRQLFRCPDLGFAYLPSGRGRGYAHEAASAVIKYAHSALQFDFLTAMTHLENFDSQKLLLKLGYKRQGKLFLKGVPAQKFYWLNLLRNDIA
ncbi:GNAT family N-acetyltransferase [Alteromonas pelagimontana]|uniref:GNAT family N-acetyltransferase n=1 Tax=Alteromonas pelagimontana TaxID=1858656 RepID=A0A6M4MDZ2_9ALTE|nr:GNAT family N-acetyltransferase [Alteromonas pelagimontana]QJR80366.1 GNAT family N-acetyltransferase [Alteromonas pelagimontana]